MTNIESVGYNAGNARPALVLADFVRLVRRFRVVQLCEVADRADELEASGAQVLQLQGQDRAHLAMLVSKPATVLASGYIRCARRSFVGAWGAGPRVLAARGILWALVDHGDGLEPVTHAVTHAVPSVQRPVKGRLAKIGRARRRAIFRKHMAATAAWVGTVQGPLDLYGDFNATPEYPDLQPLRAAGLTCSTAPSHPADHPDRDIDQHWTRGLRIEAVMAL